MLYQEAVDYIQNLEKFGSVYGLDTVRLLLKRLGNPENKFKVIHIAGTNGKGSTSCFISGILIKSGYKVGAFNSPSVFGYNERYLLDGKPIDDVSVAKYISTVAKERDKMIAEGLNAPTAFEVEFAVAALFFADNQCDFAVLECGLGGRLDATNAIARKELAIITSISYDHTAILGNTLSEIAGEKAAIVKYCPLVTYKQCDEVMNVFSKVDDLRICPQAKSLSSGKNGQVFDYKGKVYSIRQLGAYQLQNCSLAIESAEILMQKGYDKITYESIYQGVAQAQWKGRLQLVSKGNKTFLLDGAHNPDGARVLAEELKRTFPEKKCFVFGAFADKDVDGVLSHIGSLADEFIAIKPPSKRGLDESITLSKCLRYCSASISCKDMNEAIEAAYSSSCELIVVCGSLSILDSALTEIEKLK
ncbi:MAG: bifunctional folylpolyglutamate synthase/dihydrofolate synthase [Clostridia bacterium]|nr:bifunctional folylpolyglutamate synthase/dihydrofolate synthase [Clostridia bacterium]MDE7329019.1 bifunctional folylpolyglutamate synthase/dihydrofolate synthase [Clostridia bacterium]